MTTFCARVLLALSAASILGGTVMRALRKEAKAVMAGVPILYTGSTLTMLKLVILWKGGVLSTRLAVRFER